LHACIRFCCLTSRSDVLAFKFNVIITLSGPC
jgi:hypothetical protein